MSDATMPSARERIGDAVLDALCKSPVWHDRHIGELEVEIADSIGAALLADGTLRAVIEAEALRTLGAVIATIPGGVIDVPEAALRMDYEVRWFDIPENYVTRFRARAARVAGGGE